MPSKFRVAMMVAGTAMAWALVGAGVAVGAGLRRGLTLAEMFERKRLPGLLVVAGVFGISMGGAVAGRCVELCRQWPARCAELGLCPKCTYDLTGNVSGVCPECGRPVGR